LRAVVRRVARQEGDSKMEKDPVCGMEVNPATAQETIDYQGKTYYFCAPGCRRSFEADPTEYLDPNYKPSM